MARKVYPDICTFPLPVEESGKLFFDAFLPDRLKALQEKWTPANYKRRTKAQQALWTHLLGIMQRERARTEEELWMVSTEPRDIERYRAVPTPPRGAQRKHPDSQYWGRPHPLRQRRMRYYDAAARRDGCHFMLLWGKKCNREMPPWVKACAETKLPPYPTTARERADARRRRFHERKQRPLLGVRR